MTELEEIIPLGPYCYSDRKTCPYWEYIERYKAKCNYLRIEDNKNDVDLLWDQIKLCGVNNPDDEIEETI